MKRQIIEIDEPKCTGCGICAEGCHEGALQIINGKAVLVSELLCDGLGACIKECPEGAITITEKEAEPYNEEKVMEHLSPKGKDVIIAHLKHLKEHGETMWLKKGVEWMQQNQDKLNFNPIEVMQTVHQHKSEAGCACQGSTHQTLHHDNTKEHAVVDVSSALEQWPVQMHLINPQSSIFFKSDLLLAADCVAFTMGNFHQTHLRGKKLAIACPKLDQGKESYIDKLVQFIDLAQVNTITVMIMEVPCCGGLLRLVQMAQEQAHRKVPVKAITVSLKGEIISEEWL